MSVPTLRTRTLALAALVAALAVALLWRAASTPAHERSAQLAERTAPVRPVGADTSLDDVSAASNHGSDAVAVEASVRSAATSEFHVVGTVRLASPIGPLGEHMSGSLTYSLGRRSEHDSASELHETPIADSSWRFAAREGATVHWRSARIDGNLFSVQPTSTVVTGGEPVKLLLHPPPGLKLHVVDALSGEQLDGIEVHRGRGVPSDVRAAPAARAVPFGIGLTSPISLTRLQGVEVFCVRRAGYSWSHVVVDQRENVDRCVALHAACEARVRVDGPLPPGDALVVIEYFDGEPSDAGRARPSERALVRTVRTEQLPVWESFELPPGRWRARIGSDGGTLYDGVHASFETLPGAVTDVVLDGRWIEPPRESSTPESSVSFEVELLSDDLPALGEIAYLVSDLPSADPRARVHVAFVDARPNAENGPCAALGFDDVAPGAYRLVLAKTQWSTTLFVDADGAAPKVIRVPALVPASFAFHDAFTGKPVEINSAHWSAAGLGAQPTPAVRVPDASAWRVDSHADEFDFILFVAGGTAPLEVTARVATRSEVTHVGIELGASLTVALRDATASVFARHAWWQAIEILDEHGVRVKVAPSVEASVPFARQAEYRLPRAGRFTVRLPPLNSHHAAPPQVVELASGAVQRLEFQLTALGCR